MNAPLVITQFTDYRAFLLCHAKAMKKRNVQWSYSAWAKRMKLKSASSITKIIHGKREPGATILERMESYFAFAPREAEYFRDLVALHKVKRDPRLSALLMERISRAHEGDGVSEMDHRTFSVISSWYCLAVREMTALSQFVEDPDWMSRQFISRVTPRETKQAIHLLIAVGLLKRDSQRRLVFDERQIETKTDVASEAVKQYHEQMLDRARETLRLVSPEQRDYSSSSFVMNAGDLPAAKLAIKTFRRKFMRRFERPNGDTLYQYQVQLFPLTHPGGIPK